MLVGEGDLSVINEEGCDLVLLVGKELAATLHGGFRVTSSASSPLLTFAMEVKCSAYMCVSVPKFRNKALRGQPEHPKLPVSRGSPPDSKLIPTETGQSS